MTDPEDLVLFGLTKPGEEEQSEPFPLSKNDETETGYT